MNGSKNAFAALLDIFIEPRKALAAAREHTLWFWAPLSVYLLLNIAFWVYFYLTVDFDWFVARLMSMSGQEMSAAEIEQAASFMSPGIMLAGSVFGVVAVTFITYAIYALYLHIVAKVSGDQSNGYGRWFSLTAWSYFPMVLMVAGMWVNYLLAGTRQIGQEELAVTNLNSLIFRMAPDNSWFTLLNSLDITLIWSLGLLSLGVGMYSGRTFGKSAVIAVAPYAVIYGI